MTPLCLIHGVKWRCILKQRQIIETHTHTTMSTVKRYQIELNTPQAERWQQVIDDFRPLFPQIRSTLRALLQAQGYTWYFQMMCRGGILMYSRNQIMYANEIQSIATALEMRFDEILVMQFVYELNSACTSIVMTSTNQDERQMFRTMDWDLELLKRLTIEVEYLRDGVPLYVCSSWFGFVGCLTGLTYETMNDQIRVPAYAIAVNFRRTQPMTLSLILQNVARTLALHWPVSYLVRNVLGSGTSNMSYKVQCLKETSLISPCYIIFAQYSNLW